MLNWYLQLLSTACRLTTTAVCCLGFSWARAAEIDFNRDIRPLLNEHCVACHGGVKQTAGLSFVYEDQALSVVEPGDPEASYMLDRVTSTEPDEVMPPPEHGRALNEAEIQLLRAWIEQGATWGRHWSFIPPQAAAQSNPPAEHAATQVETTWARTSIDPFVLDKLRQNELEPAAAASPERWLRRVTLDLTGLPPTLEQQQSFVDDARQHGEAAYEQVVEQLLNSPAYGERWASVWLDAVRYADSRGLGLDGRRTIWKYRDWVIKAFNQDMPFDEFTVKQIAGDLLPEPTLDDIVATACHRLTQTNEEGGTDDEEFRVEAVIDRVNTTWQVWQGLSFGCVQCHSHPYDPIEHDEYYKFLAFFNNTADADLSNDEPSIAVPLDDSLADEALALDRDIRRLQDESWQAGYQLLQDESMWRPLPAMSATTNSETQVEVAVVDGVQEVRTVGNVAKNTTIIVESVMPAEASRLTAFRFTGLPKDAAWAMDNSEWGFVLSHVKAELLPSDGSESQELTIAEVVADEPQPLMNPGESLNAKSSQGFGAYSRMHYPRSAAFVLEQSTEFAAGDRLRISLSQKVFELGAFPLVAHRSVLSVSDSAAWHEWQSSESQRALQSELAELTKQRRAIASVNIPILRERPQSFMRPTKVFERGNFLTKTDLVEPSTPAFLPLLPEADGRYDRLDLAAWFVSADNPLTARVTVNRFWAQLFGTGLVETQEDFGSSGASPSHPRLLDDLAIRFRTQMKWSTKSLLRELVLSSTYRQAAQVTPAKLQKDPQNRLLSRGPRKRLPAETIRDSALAISGLLNTQAFGPPVHPPIPDGVWKPFQAGDKWTTAETDDPNRYRRTIYTYTKRSIPFPVTAAFDAPSREACSMRRLPSNTPLQALMTLNDSVFVESAQALADRMLAAGDRLDQQLSHGILLATCRQPLAAEIEELKNLIAGDASVADEDIESRRIAMKNVAAVLLNLDEVLSK